MTATPKPTPTKAPTATPKKPEASTPIPKPNTMKFVWPVPDGPHTINSEWGYRTSINLHEGIDITCELLPVRAAMSGTVKVADWKGKGGKQVEIIHENGYMTMYAHLDSIDEKIEKTRGTEHVEAGYTIGTSGDTGEADGYHLHFGIYWRSAENKPYVCINPLLDYHAKDRRYGSENPNPVYKKDMNLPLRKKNVDIEFNEGFKFDFADIDPQYYG